MTYKNLEIVALNHDILEYGLKKGDTGTIVEIYDGGEIYEVEFITSKGKTTALLTLNITDIGPTAEINLKSQKAERSDRVFQNSIIDDLPFTPNYYSNTYDAYI
ncbi:MAG: DUF4926 domain-containing protein [Candidatus Daviesbacteria bacterium]|nr:DUF4926 domain-containing protein [Candidatus Daviesbacteria bacterium]